MQCPLLPVWVCPPRWWWQCHCERLPAVAARWRGGCQRAPVPHKPAPQPAPHHPPYLQVRKDGQLTAENIKEPLREIRRALLEADVSLPVVRRFVRQVEEAALGEVRGGGTGRAGLQGVWCAGGGERRWQ